MLERVEDPNRKYFVFYNNSESPDGFYKTFIVKTGEGAGDDGAI